MSLLPFLRPEKECQNTSKSRRSPVVVNKVFSKVNSAIHGKGKKRGKYQKLSPENKAVITKYASENGVARAVRKFKEKKLKESRQHERLAKFVLQRSRGEAEES